jgi:hypothetical protein
MLTDAKNVKPNCVSLFNELDQVLQPVSSLAVRV